ncbi:pentapeptide repeat-containing protein [Nibrella saemangeumensis]|uniref:Pentapeptide repeat-containing protein n=1 Tax=Nibrella saemangeumensis TaxID=1084526 RepID=A0ABP8N7M2_9BACT
MADQIQLSLLKQGHKVWNQWREDHPEVKPDLVGANLSRAELYHTNLEEADLQDADLQDANLFKANLFRANLNNAKLNGAKLDLAYLDEITAVKAQFRNASLKDATLYGGDLRESLLWGTNLYNTVLSFAKLQGSTLWDANLTEASLNDTDLTGAHLQSANFNKADLSNARLIKAGMERCTLVKTKLDGAVLEDCNVYGISAWDLDLSKLKQQNLVINSDPEAPLIVDNLEMAQFIYLILNNKKLKDVIDTITSKAVLILGRFTEKRKAVLDAIREELRKQNLTPILFDFNKPASKDLTGTVETLARLSKFIIADVTNPMSIQHELAYITKELTTTPILPIKLKGSKTYTMLKNLKRYPWFMPIYEYIDQESLIAELSEVIRPANEKADSYRQES